MALVPQGGGKGADRLHRPPVPLQQVDGVDGMIHQGAAVVELPSAVPAAPVRVLLAPGPLRACVARHQPSEPPLQENRQTVPRPGVPRPAPAAPARCARPPGGPGPRGWLQQPHLHHAPAASAAPEDAPEQSVSSKESRSACARLLAKAHEVHALRCSRCGSPMKVLAGITDPPGVRRIPLHLIKTGAAPPAGLPAQVDHPIPFRASGQIPALRAPGPQAPSARAPNWVPRCPPRGSPGRGRHLGWTETLVEEGLTFSSDTRIIEMSAPTTASRGPAHTQRSQVIRTFLALPPKELRPDSCVPTMVLACSLLRRYAEKGDDANTPRRSA
jgi:hypothetical protein